MGSIDYFRATRPDTGQIRKLIENGLLFDWALTIEYVNGNSENAFWQQWDKCFFALSSAEPVIVALMDCYNNNPGYIIRLSAEKFNPQTRMVHTVYKPILQSAAASHPNPGISILPHSHIEESATSNSGLSM